MVQILLQLNDTTHWENKSFWLFTLHTARKNDEVGITTAP